MLFHVGSLLRLNEAGILQRLNRVSSVSGGSITAGVLGMNWKRLNFQLGTANAGVAANLEELLVEPIRQMASETIDRESILGGVFTPGVTISDFVTRAYRKFLFDDATLQSLPADDEGPRFVINATNIQTASLVRFSRPYLADYRVGMIRNPNTPLATAVAASSAFPPVLSPATLDVDPNSFDPDPSCPLQTRPYNDTMILSDGGVYDNLGLETVIKRYRTVLVSDAGARSRPCRIRRPIGPSNQCESSTSSTTRCAAYGSGISSTRINGKISMEPIGAFGPTLRIMVWQIPYTVRMTKPWQSRKHRRG